MQDLNIKLASVIALKNEIIWNWKNRKGKKEFITDEDKELILKNLLEALINSIPQRKIQ